MTPSAGGKRPLAPVQQPAVTFIIIVCLIGLATAWHTWQTNPLYSMRSTVRFTLIVFLTTGAVIAAIVTTVHLTKDSSESVASTAMLCVCGISTLALIYAVMTATSPPAPALPAGTQLLTTMRGKMMPWVLYTLALVFVTAVLSLTLPDMYRILPLSLGGIGSFIAVMLVFTRYLQALGYDRGLTAIEVHPWVRWTYTADEWSRHTDSQRRDLEALPPEPKARNWRAAILLSLAAITVSFASTGGPQREKLFFTLAVFAVLGVTFAVTSVAHAHAPHRRRAFLITTKNEACFGEQGLFVEGQFSPWITSINALETASIDATPPRSLIFSFSQMMVTANYFGASLGYSALGMDRVLIPDGPPALVAADLERLERSLRVTCPEAAIELT